LLCLALPALGANVQQHIVGGSETTIGQHPHQLSLRANGIHRCGASLIGDTRAVTAAHCVGSAIGTYVIWGGTTDRTATNCGNCINRDLNLLTRHPNYAPTPEGYYTSDIAVIGFLAVLLNIDLQPIALATPSDGLFAGEICTITGWGSISATAPNPDILHEAQLTVLTEIACENTWGQLPVDDDHICGYDALMSACTGDEGGPMVCNNLLAGALSWTDPSCDPNFPSVYTRIDYFQEWIILQ
jgi:secreted trypsin-like serine protease